AALPRRSTSASWPSSGARPATSSPSHSNAPTPRSASTRCWCTATANTTSSSTCRTSRDAPARVHPGPRTRCGQAPGRRVKPPAARRVRVKICGITNPADAVAAERAGADAIGLIFAASKRQVDRAAAAEILAAVGPFVTTVGVFRGAPLDEVLETVAELRLDAAQVHEEADASYLAAVRRRAKVVLALPFSAAG